MVFRGVSIEGAGFTHTAISFRSLFVKLLYFVIYVMFPIALETCTCARLVSTRRTPPVPPPPPPCLSYHALT